jgi:hypothetical protein
MKAMGGDIAIGDSTDLLFNGTGFGWAGLFHDSKNFHGRMVAQSWRCDHPTSLINSASTDINKPASALTAWLSWTA